MALFVHLALTTHTIRALAQRSDGQRRQLEMIEA
jgi:hypothetical protein